MKNICLILLTFFSLKGFSQNQIGQVLSGNNTSLLFGESIAISSDGNTMVLGIPSTTTFSANSSVKVYKKNGNIWEILGNTIQTFQNDLFGKSVAISADGTIVAIGSPKEGTLGLTRGFVRVYQYDTNTAHWFQIGQQLEGTFSSSEFGTSLSLSADGNLLAVGSPGDNKVRVFEKQINSWNQIGSFSGQGSTSFGNVLVLSSDGKVLALGSGTANNSTGLVRLYSKLVNNTWQQLGQDIIGDNVGDGLGRAVSINNDGTIVAIGIPLSDSNASNSGKVRMYNYVNSNWVQLGNDINGQNIDDIFGNVVSISNDGTVLAIGTHRYDSDDKGIVQVYKYSSNTWQQVGNSVIGFPLEQCGNSLSLSGDGNSVAIGSVRANPTGPNFQKVVVYDFTSVLDTQNFQLNNQISIYPNPVQDILNVEIKDAEIANIEILSLEGKQIMTTTNKPVNTSNLTNGMYLIKVYSVDGKVGVKKIIK